MAPSRHHRESDPALGEGGDPLAKTVHARIEQNRLGIAGWIRKLVVDWTLAGMQHVAKRSAAHGAQETDETVLDHMDRILAKLPSRLRGLLESSPQAAAFFSVLEDKTIENPGGIADAIAEFRQSEEVRRSALPVGRNAPCPCGCGKKYKKCPNRKRGAHR